MTQIDLKAIFADPDKRRQQLEFSRQRYAEFSRMAAAANPHWAGAWRELAALHKTVIDTLEQMESANDEN